MPQKLKEVDVVVIGVGFAGSILAKNSRPPVLRSSASSGPQPP